MLPELLIQNFMIRDTLSLFLATLILPLFVFIPGYVIGWVGDIFAFRQRRDITQFLIGIVLSIALLPSFTYIVARLSSLDVSIAIYALSWLCFVWIAFREKITLRAPKDRWVLLAGMFTLFWVGIAFLSLPDLQIGERLYANEISHDHQTRVALTDAIFRTGVPPVNPHIYPGKPLLVSYFYFWNLFPAMLSRLTGGLIDARISFFASAVWAGIGLRAIACVYLRMGKSGGKHNIGRRSAAAVGLCLITGLDVIFATVLIQRFNFPLTVMEWWNGNSQVTSFVGASLWVPHHVGGLVAGITGILLFQEIFQVQSRRTKIALAALTGLSLASLAGLSLYVAFVFVVFWCLLTIGSIIWREWRRYTSWLIITGSFAVLLSGMFVFDLITSRDSFIAGGGFLVFEVRQFGFLRSWYSQWPTLLVNVFNLVMLPLNYFCELGFFFFAGWYYIRAAGKDQKHFLRQNGIELLLLLTSLGICSFFRSGIISNNDIGWRGFMPVQFILLIWGADVLVQTWPRVLGRGPDSLSLHLLPFARKVLTGLVVVGLVSTLSDLISLRVYPVTSDTTSENEWTSTKGTPALGEHIYAIRKAFDYVDRHFPKTAIIQNNPAVEDIFQTQGLYGSRQTVAAGELYSFIYGDSPQVYQELSGPILSVFADPKLSFADVQRTCVRFQIDGLVVKDVDPVWNIERSWVWNADPVYENERVKVFRCGD